MFPRSIYFLFNLKTDFSVNTNREVSSKLQKNLDNCNFWHFYRNYKKNSPWIFSWYFSRFWKKNSNHLNIQQRRFQILPKSFSINYIQLFLPRVTWLCPFDAICFETKTNFINEVNEQTNINNISQSSETRWKASREIFIEIIFHVCFDVRFSKMKFSHAHLSWSI